jgi:hypothetical protein
VSNGIFFFLLNHDFSLVLATSAMQRKDPSAATISVLHDRRNQQFLFALFQLNRNSRRTRDKLFSDATDSQISALAKVVRLLMKGRIPIRKIHNERINKSGKLPHLKAHFRSKEDYHRFKSQHMQEQKKILKHVNTWDLLLYNLFKKPSKHSTGNN